MPVGAYAGANVSNGNGVTTLFPYNFKILDQTHVEVKVDGVVKALGADYTVTGVGLSNGGNVVFVVAPANGAVVQRARKVPYTRTQDYQNNGDFQENTVDSDFDLLEMQVQEVAADAARAFKAPLSVTADQVITDAGWAARAGTVLGFDALGNFVLLVAQAGTSLIDLAAQAGSSLIGFIAAGANAVKRTMQDKARERVSAFDFMTAAQIADVQAGTAALDVTAPVANALAAALAGNVVLVFPRGFYKADVNLDNTYDNLRCHFEEGAEFGGIWHLISSAAPTAPLITALARAANVVTVTAPAHGFATGKRTAIKNVTGGTTDFNSDDVTITVVDANTFTYPQVGANEAGVVGGQTVAIEKPLKGLRFTGKLTTYDRFGTINVKDCYVERVHVKSDTAKHTTFPGTKSRGAHIYIGTDDLRINELVVDDCGLVNNTDAAVSIDGNGLNPMRLSIGRIWVKASDCHAVYLTGGEHKIGEIRVDAFVAGVPVNTLQDSDGAPQSAEGKGVWINRSWDTDIGRVFVNQSSYTASGSAKYHFLLDETGISTVPGSRDRPVTIGALLIRNARRFSCSFVDGTYPSPVVDAFVGACEIQSVAGNVIDRELLSIAAATTGGRVSIDTLRFLDSAGFNCLKVYAGATRFAARLVEALAFNGQLAIINATSEIGKIRGTWSGASLAGIAVDVRSHTDSWIGDIELTSAANITTQAIRWDNCVRVKIGKIFTSGFRHAVNTLQMSTLTYCSLDELNLTGGAVTGIGLLVDTITNCAIKTGLITDFAKGTTKGAGAITRCSADNMICNANTVNTDIPIASFASATNCSNFTL